MSDGFVQLIENEFEFVHVAGVAERVIGAGGGVVSFTLKFATVTFVLFIVLALSAEDVGLSLPLAPPDMPIVPPE